MLKKNIIKYSYPLKLSNTVALINTQVQGYITVSQDRIGNTELLRRLLNCDREEHVGRVVEYINQNRDIAAEEARTVNNYGLHPFMYIQKRPFLFNQAFNQNFINLLQHNISIKGLNEKVEVDNKVYLEAKTVNPVLYKNLQTACDIANEVRSKIKYSSSHPSFNQLDNERKINITKKVSESYRLASVASKRHKEGHTSFHLASFAAAYAMNTGYGNCPQFSHAVWRLLYDDKSNDTKAAVLRIGSGNHVLNAIDNKEITDVSSFLLGNSSVFCDAWAGAVYPVSQMHTMLKAYDFIYQGKTHFNISLNYNENYHSLIKLNISPGKDKQETSHDFIIHERQAVNNNQLLAFIRHSYSDIWVIDHSTMSFYDINNGHSLMTLPRDLNSEDAYRLLDIFKNAFSEKNIMCWLIDYRNTVMKKNSYTGLSNYGFFDQPKLWGGMKIVFNQPASVINNYCAYLLSNCQDDIKTLQIN